MILNGYLLDMIKRIVAVIEVLKPLVCDRLAQGNSMSYDWHAINHSGRSM